MSASIVPPPIAPHPPTGPRPFWSVMIPTYNARADYLEETLRSVLRQDPGADEMQIEVVDDCSQGAPSELVQRIGKGRISLHREPANRGLSRIWNRCIERAEGEWVHILHQDDIVEPGFYQALRRGVQDGSFGAALTRHAIIDPRGNRLEVSTLYRDTPGIPENWSEAIAVHNPIRCPAIVVRRAVYEKLGGFLPELCYTMDWEMWQRIAAHYSYWFEPGVLAGYRTHSESATHRLTLEAVDALDQLATIKLAMAYHAPERAARLAWLARRHTARYGVDVARKLLLAGHSKSAWKQIGTILQISWAWPVLPKILLFSLLQLRLLFRPPQRNLGH